MNGVQILVATSAGQVLFPGAFIPWVVTRDAFHPELVEGGEVAVFCHRENGSHPYREQVSGLREVGCSALVRKVVADEHFTLVLEGKSRVRIADVIRDGPQIEARIVVVPERDEDDEVTRVRASMVRDVAKDIVDRMPELPHESLSLIDSVQGSGPLADLLAANLDVTLDEKAAFLATVDVKLRIERLLPLLVRQCEILAMRDRVTERVEAEVAHLDPSSIEPRRIRALQRQFLVEEGESEPVATAPTTSDGLRGMLSRLAGQPSTRKRLEAELEELRARARREARQLQIRAIDEE